MVGKDLVASSRIDIGGITLNCAKAGPRMRRWLSQSLFCQRSSVLGRTSAFEGSRFAHDARGHGESGTARAVLLEMTRGMSSVVGWLDIERAHLRRLDGRTIMQTVADHPGRVASLALVTTTSEYSDDQLQAWRDRAASLARRYGGGARTPHGPVAHRDAAGPQSGLRLHG